MLKSPKNESKTASWWRPCDIVVSRNGTVQVQSPDLTVPLSAGRSAVLTEKHYRH